MLRLSEKFLFAELTERLRTLEGGEPELTWSSEKLKAFSASHLFFPVTWNTCFQGFCFPFCFIVIASDFFKLLTFKNKACLFLSNIFHGCFHSNPSDEPNLN